jgi:hypothetical protein
MVRKEYSAPVIQTENVVLGVFGMYATKSGNDNGGGNPLAKWMKPRGGIIKMPHGQRKH